MGFLSRFKGHSNLKPEPDGLWQTTSAKLEALERDVENHSSRGPVVVLAHFESTQREIVAALAPRLGIDGTARALDVLDALANPRAGAVVLALASQLAGLSTTATSAFDGEASLLVAERHPIRDFDDSICQAATGLPYSARVRFFLSLEDELIRRFAGEHLRTTMTALGLGADEEVSHKMVSKAIENAQKKTKNKARSNVASASPADWFQVNCGP